MTQRRLPFEHHVSYGEQIRRLAADRSDDIAITLVHHPDASATRLTWPDHPAVRPSSPERSRRGPAAGRRAPRTSPQRSKAPSDRSPRTGCGCSAPTPVLDELWHARAGSISGSQRQQVARASLADPRVLLLDEPSVGLSPKLAGLVLSTVVSLRRDGHVIVLVEQNVHQALAVADSVGIMRAGVMEQHGLDPVDIARQDLTMIF